MNLFPSSKNRSAEVSQEAMEACEHIIKEMGAELHDDLIQKLSILRLHLDKLERSSFDPSETRDLVIKMQSEFQGIIEAVRSISRRLLPVRMDSDDFHKRVEMVAQNLDIPGVARIQCDFIGTPLPLNNVKEIYLLRMIQELIQNSFRHSSAWQIWIRVKWTDKLLTIEVEDDGAGFAHINDFIKRLKSKHNSLRMRSEAIGSTLNYGEGSKGLLARIELTL